MQQVSFAFGSGIYQRLSETISRRLPQTKKSTTAAGRRSPSPPAAAAAVTHSGALLLFLLLLLVGAFASSRWINAVAIDTQGYSLQPISGVATARNRIFTAAVTVRNPPPSASPQPKPDPKPKPGHKVGRRLPLTCDPRNRSAAHYTCPPPPPPPPLGLSGPIAAVSGPAAADPPPSTCPDYFRWIHEDLRPWAATGITRDAVERARRTANFRLVVLGGRAFIERYRRSFQTRDVFTIWGILQLLRRYPGRVPDLELMFDCVDWPVVKKATNRGRRNASAPPSPPPPLFRYCGDDSTLDIVFPDWSFWGWPEINIKPWEALLKDLKRGNERVKWMDREPHAYWKGNPAVAATRQDLLRCNVSDTHDWNARIYAQDWQSESKLGFKQSDLASQCAHRYKIYIEGSAWSVSEKYILACDSLTLLVRPRYYDFFTRGLMPVHHYWPVRDDDKCRSIKFAVDWGNTHKRKAQAIGGEASRFIQEQLKPDHVYDYMFHLLNEYAKLLRFTPTKPPAAVEYCPESMACPAGGRVREFMMESAVGAPRDAPPCTLPPPFSPQELASFNRRKANSIKQVELWEQKAWEKEKGPRGDPN